MLKMMMMDSIFLILMKESWKMDQIISIIKRWWMDMTLYH